MSGTPSRCASRGGREVWRDAAGSGASSAERPFHPEQRVQQAQFSACFEQVNTADFGARAALAVIRAGALACEKRSALLQGRRIRFQKARSRFRAFLLDLPVRPAGSQPHPRHLFGETAKPVGVLSMTDIIRKVAEV